MKSNRTQQKCLCVPQDAAGRRDAAPPTNPVASIRALHAGAKRIASNPRGRQTNPGTSILLTLLIVLAAPAYAAYPNGYSNCKVVTTLHTMVSGANDLTNYPLTVVLTDPALKSTANGGGVNNSNGYDIAFYPDCSGVGIALKWELESYSPATGAIVAHVLRPTLSHTTDDTIGMYYGGVFSSFQSTASAVWDANYKGVWHLPDGATLTASDSTANAQTGTITAPTPGTGTIGGAASFGPTDRIDMGNITSLNGATAATWSLWVKFNSLSAATRGLLSKWGVAVATFLITAENSEVQAAITNADASNYNIQKTVGAGITTGTWYHVTATYTANTNLLVYINGVKQATNNASTAPIASLTTSSSSLQVGFETAESRTALDGIIDEVRISNIARSPDWILTEYRNQSSPATYISVGPQLTYTPYSNGYSYCKVVSTRHTMVSGASDLANYPLTVVLTDPDLRTTTNGGMVNNGSGYDIGFYPDCSGSGTPLKWEMESYSATTGAIIAHVLRPTLSHTTDDTIGMYYGGAFSTFQSTASAVWDSDYKAVWHFPDGGSLSATDSTANAHTGSPTGMSAGAGRLDGAASFDGSSGFISNPSSTDYDAAIGTWSFWFNLNSTAGLQAAMARANPSTSYQGLTIILNSDILMQGKYSGGNAVSLNYAASLATGTWYSLQVVYNRNNGGANSIYLNGVLVATANSAGAWSFNNQTLFLGKSTDSFWNLFNGLMDEVRISSIARSSDWILTEYRNQSAPATYLSVGPRLSASIGRVRHSVKIDQ
jgi:hypothetical protein